MKPEYGTQYTISSVILSEEGKDDEFILLDSSEFTTPLGPSVSAIGCDFDSSTLNNVVLTVTSSGMNGETFTVEVSEKQDASNILSFSMTFSSTSGSKNVAVYKQTGTLEYGKEYELVKVFSSTVNAVIPSPALVFEVPAAPSRIVRAECDLGGTNETEALIALEGLFLPGGKSFSITLFKLESDVRTGDAFTLTGTISGTGNQTSTLLTETLYPSHANLSFGTDYEITALKIAETKTIVDEPTRFWIPAEPSRIVRLKNSPNVDGNRTEIVLVGRWMEAGDYTVTLSPSASFTVKFEGTKTEERESKPTTLWLYGSSVDLSFDVSYTLVSVVKATADAPDIFIDQPIAPFLIAEKTRLTEMRLESYSLDKKKADFVMTGLLLSASKIYEVELKSASLSRWIAMKVDGSEWKGEAVLYPSADATLKYGDSYSINGFREQGTTVELLHDTVEVIEIIPEPPRLISCSAEAATGLHTTTLTLITLALTSGANYSLMLRGSKLDENDETSNAENSNLIISVLGGETISQVLTLYPLSDADVEYGMNYSIISLSTEGETQPVLIEPIASSFATPSLPFRVENALSELTLSRSEVKIVLTGTSFPTRSEPSQVIEVTLTGGTLGSPLTVSGEFDEDGWILLKCWTETGHSHKLDFGQWYSVSSVSVASLSALVNHHVSFIVPPPPKVTEAWLRVNNSMGTGVRLVVSGEGLALSGEYEVELNNSLSFPIEFHSATSGTSPSLLPIGGTNPLRFGQTYEITKISKSDNPVDLVLSSGVLISALAAPTEIELFSDSSSSDSSFLCGEKTNPCHSMDAAWRIAESIGAKEIDIKLLNASRQSNVMKIGKDCLLAFERGGFAEPRLEIGADVSHESEQGLIVVDEGRFELRDVDVSIRPSSSDFVFLCVSDGIVVMKDSAIVGSSKSDSTHTLSNDDTVCWWSSGVIVLNNSHTSIHSTEFSFIPQGVFQQLGGLLTIETSAFHDNSPQSQSSPSARRNIACSENGKVEIQTLSAGDGVRGSSGWIAADECEVSGTDSTPNSPLFIPTLDTANSTVTLNKKTKSFLFSLSGSLLIECGLSVEVYEINEKTKLTGQNVSLPLSSLTPSPNNESSLVFSLTTKELSRFLNEDMEWRMDLGFGKDQHTKWVLVQKSKQGKIAQSFGEALPWLIPVIVASIVVLFLLLILLICLRRRQKAKQKKQPLTTQELDEDQLEMKEDLPVALDNTAEGILRNNTAEFKLQAEEKSSDPTLAAFPEREPIRAMVHVMECQGEYATRAVVKTETLYDRLHRTKQPNWNTDRLRMIQQLVRGLAVARQSNTTDQILTELSPHKIVVNDSDEVFLLMADTDPTYPRSYQPVFVASQNENGQVAQEGETRQNQTEHLPTHPPHSAEPETEPAVVEQSPHEGNQLALLPQNDVFFRLPQSAVTADGKSTLTSSSMMKANENVRWTPPEVTGRKSGVDKEKAAVFSLGLILWEMETGEVPFGELDAMNAHRQIGVGGEMLMRKVCSETASLVRQCISLDPVTRPTLEQVASTLGFSLTTQTMKKGQSQQNEAIGV
ncbi:hypothetical protein BLNAU_18681 [Blattamonas nauphoetae]|uniref:Protein kinase domain-containing protein n=1 Tax=Blattamonas nauphoetae TaxID=2049346 RepID=A0ABQ9X3S8_9EUKA|nr:hypothetical protein BLNAU_18681 [Blattamonas nauphoetae]